MISTVAQVKTRVLALLDDDAGAIFTDAVVTAGFNEAYDALRSALLRCQIPLIEKIVSYTLAANTTSFTPADAGISDFGELVELEERTSGSTDRYYHIWERDKLTQRDASNTLGEFVWRLDAFQFIGATEAREVRITYWESSTPPSSGSVSVDGAITFLSKYTAGVAGPRKGHEYAEKYYVQAVGPNYPEHIGGELFALIQPMVRSRQRVQVAPKPYSVIRRRWRRPATINITTAGGSGDVPTVFTSYAGTVTGTIDGTNATFYIGATARQVEVILNGATLTADLHYTHATNVITFLGAYIPQPGADIIVRAWL